MLERILTPVSPSITQMIRLDHTHAIAAFHRFRADLSEGRQRMLVQHLCIALEIHAQLEEEIFYPAMRALPADVPQVDTSLQDHATMKSLIARIKALKPSDPEFEATLMELMRCVLHHVADEETVLLPHAERYLPERLQELGAQMMRRRLELTRPRAGAIAVSGARTFPVATVALAAGALGALGATLWGVQRLRQRGTIMSS